jgi:hypothetical protein
MAYAMTEYQFEDITTNLINAYSIAYCDTPAFCRENRSENRMKQNNKAQ